MAVPTSELQGISPSSIIELFVLELNALQHGAAATYRFHAGTSMVNNGDVVWAGNTYQRFPIEADGFEYTGQGTLPRPRIRCSNIFGTITAILLTLPSGLEGAKVTRIRTMARYLDAVNFPGSTNPYGTPDPTAEFPREIYYIDRKSGETRDLVEFELASAFDLVGVRAPKRQCISSICQWRYRSAECSYTSVNNFSGTYARVGTTITVTAASHGLVAGKAVHLNFTTGTATSGYYTVVMATSGNFTVTSTTSGSTSGSVSATQWYDTNDAPVYTLAEDVCGKRISSCKARFGQTAELPFGSFVGVGTYYT